MSRVAVSVRFDFHLQGKRQGCKLKELQSPTSRAARLSVKANVLSAAMSNEKPLVLFTK
jgi:hypothetical protein